MRAAPAALAMMLLLFRSGTVRAEPCAPRASLTGEKRTVERVTTELARLGVAAAAPASADRGDTRGDDVRGSCAVVRARVSVDKAGRISVAVAVRGAGREVRVVSDPALAAAWIDSWTRTDLDNSLWATVTTDTSTEDAAIVSRTAMRRAAAADARSRTAALATPRTRVDVPKPAASNPSAAPTPPIPEGAATTTEIPAAKSPPQPPSSPMAAPTMSMTSTTSTSVVAPSTKTSTPTRLPGPRVATIADEPRDTPPTTPRTGSSIWDRIAIAAGYERTHADVTWTGAGVGACVRIGEICVGGRARIGFDPTRTHNETAVARNDVAVMATASRSLAVGRMIIAPELGLGVGRLATRRVEGTCTVMMPPANCDVMTDPMCTMTPPTPGDGTCVPDNPTGGSPKLHVGDNFKASTIAPRVSVALRVAVPLFEHVWLDGLAGWSYTPFAHTEAFRVEKMIDPNTTPPDLVALPGEPGSGYVLGIGLRVGAR